MFYHIAFLTLISDLPEDFDDLVDRQLERIREQCHGLVEIFLKPNISDRGQAYTHGMVSRFESSGAHDDYQAAEAHQQFKNFMAPYIRDAIFFDLEL